MGYIRPNVNALAAILTAGAGRTLNLCNVGGVGEGGVSHQRLLEQGLLCLVGRLRSSYQVFLSAE